MTREQAKQNLIAIGVAEPTDEQVSNYLNQVNGETKKEKDRADGYKAKADTADDLQKQLDELQAGNLTELEKANKALDAANQQIAELQKNNAIRDLLEKIMERTKKRTTRAKATNERKRSGIGDIVKVMETRPLSKDKRWRLVEVIEKAR